jgi:hypothetical protein
MKTMLAAVMACLLVFANATSVVELSKRNEFKEAGREFGNAFKGIGRGTGHVIDGTTEGVVQGTRTVGQGLDVAIDGTVQLGKNTGRAFKELGRGIKRGWEKFTDMNPVD